MNKKINLHIPRVDELEYREKLLSQEDTMSHQKNKNLASKYYHQKTGCIDFPRHKWEAWYEEYTDNESDLFYAFVQDDNKTNIGEVSFYKSSDGIIHDLNILIESKYRKKGYAQEALYQSLLIAFNKYDANWIELELNQKDNVSIKLFKNAGFNPGNDLGDKREYNLRKKDFLINEHEKKMYS